MALLLQVLRAQAQVQELHPNPRLMELLALHPSHLLLVLAVGELELVLPTHLLLLLLVPVILHMLMAAALVDWLLDCSLLLGLLLLEVVLAVLQLQLEPELCCVVNWQTIHPPWLYCRLVLLLLLRGLLLLVGWPRWTPNRPWLLLEQQLWRSIHHLLVVLLVPVRVLLLAALSGNCWYCVNHPSSHSG